MAAQGQAALLVGPRDPRGLAAGELRLLASPGLARALTLRAREEVGRYSWSSVSREWAAVYSGDAA
jgi:glycosyltransferase involved in cell wall biosynthesis